ncbi:two-component system, OmpR family, phosphate regulon sensor histidine kinase PhoR [Thermoflexales bacterium]|nr:two-component system, OmpR family, phosphate regulon sensor histidine kinase PhoR [Thermoflexales bacterium]
MSPLTPEERLESYKRLLVISQVLTSTLELFTLLDLIVNAARDLTRTEATSILLLDNKTGDLYFEAVTGSKSEEIKRMVVPPDSLAGWVVREGHAQIINDVSRDERFFAKSDESTGFQTRSLIAVPLKVKDKIIGVLEAINRADDTPFIEEDVEMMTTLSAQAAIAITNARLFQQSDLISEMVHELRTPLTSIVAYSELMLRREIPPLQARGFTETIYQEAMHLSSMTNGFLELSRLQSGRIRMDMINFNLTELVREVMQLLQPQTDEHGLTLSATLPDRNVIITADRERIRQVLVNLTSNAIKYNRDAGRVNILIEPLAAPYVRISIKDTGRGIPEKDLPRIFEKFFRVADSEGYATGTGLGLSIVKQIVEAHGSTIDVQSQVDVGTTFSFILKAAPAP